MLLAYVFGEIVELERAVLEPLDELVSAMPHGATRTTALVAVVRIVPIERPRGQLLASQDRREADTVDVLLGSLR